MTDKNEKPVPVPVPEDESQGGNKANTDQQKNWQQHNEKNASKKR